MNSANKYWLCLVFVLSFTPVSFADYKTDIGYADLKAYGWSSSHTLFYPAIKPLFISPLILLFSYLISCFFCLHLAFRN